MLLMSEGSTGNAASDSNEDIKQLQALVAAAQAGLVAAELRDMCCLSEAETVAAAGA